MFKDIYQKTLKLAGHKSSKFYLALVSFAESSFFPIPPDIMIVPMVIAKKNDYLKIFLIATFSSAVGGLLGYFIGFVFLDLAMNVIEFYGYEEKVINLKNNLSIKPPPDGIPPSQEHMSWELGPADDCSFLSKTVKLK